MTLSLRPSAVPSLRAAAVPAGHQRRRLSAVALLTTLLAGFASLLAGPASAHDSLVSSDPVDGAQLTAAPAAVTLTFSANLQPLGGLIVVTDGSGTQVASGEPAVDGATSSLPLPADLPDDTYTVAWRAVSSDGHPIEGTFAYTVDAPAAEPSLGPDEEPGEMTTQEAPTEEPTSGAPSDDASDTTTTDASDASDDDSGLPWPGIIIGAVLGITAGTVIAVRAKKRATKE